MSRRDSSVSLVVEKYAFKPRVRQSNCGGPTDMQLTNDTEPLQFRQDTQTGTDGAALAFLFLSKYCQVGHIGRDRVSRVGQGVESGTGCREWDRKELRPEF
jgi:hypothetical protein